MLAKLKARPLFADGAHDRKWMLDKADFLDFVVEIIRRSDDQDGFHVLPRTGLSSVPLAG